jgi:tetratricopeptide (TPR) repeat protein
MDFGLAKQSGAETRSMTMAGAGTLAYMSPEQVRGDHVDPRSDIWSLGVLMYQMVTGRRPFEGDYDASVLYSIVNDKHLPAVEIVKDIPPEISAIIERALNKSPDDRYVMMEDLRIDLIAVRDYLFGEPDKGATGKGFIAGTTHIFGWKLTTVLALSVSAVLIFFIMRYIITGGKDHGVESTGTELTMDEIAHDPGELSEAEVLYSSGAELYHSGNQTKGIPLIEHALELDPEHLNALKTLAVFYDWGGDFERAAGYIERAKNIADKRGNTPEYARCTIIQAKVLHKWDLALKLFEEYLANDPAAVTTHIEIGYILSRYVGDNQGALEHYSLFFDLDPENSTGRHAQAYNYTGTARLNSGEFDKAIEAFTRYRDLLPNSPDPVSSLAGAYLFAGDYDEAYRLYSSLLKIDDPAYTVHEGLAKICSATGRLRESNEHYHHYLGSVTFKGQKVNGHLQIARNYLSQKDTDSFDREMTAIDEIDPDAARACWLRGVRFITLDMDIARARGELDRLTTLMEKPFVFEETSHHEHLLGLILLAEGRTVGALEALQESVIRSPRDFFFFGREYARVLLLTGRTDDAVKECLDLSRFNPNDPELLMILCGAKTLKGDMESAEDYYRRTLEILTEADVDYVPLIDFRRKFEKPESK